MAEDIKIEIDLLLMPVGSPILTALDKMNVSLGQVIGQLEQMKSQVSGAHVGQKASGHQSSIPFLPIGRRSAAAAKVRPASAPAPRPRPTSREGYGFIGRQPAAPNSFSGSSVDPAPKVLAQPTPITNKHVSVSSNRSSSFSEPELREYNNILQQQIDKVDEELLERVNASNQLMLNSSGH